MFGGGLRPLDGFEVRVRPELVGCRYAYKDGGVLYVSPAMWDLLIHADASELATLVKTILVVDVECYNPFKVLAAWDVRRVDIDLGSF